MKRILIVLTILVVLMAGCKNTAVSDQYADTDKTTPDAETDQSVSFEVEDVSEQEEAEPEAPTLQMPTLPDMDFTGLTFKDDGYEIVEFRSIADGDTANFVVGGMNMPCRFLAIDTPETSGTTGIQPWALKAKEFTQNALENAETIIIEKDLESDIVDSYGRLLVWVWVDGELLNYQLVEEGLAYVKYLYGDYKYNPQMIALESAVQKTDIKIWGEDDPDFDYEGTVQEVSIAEAKLLPAGTNVKIRGIVTNYIGQNAFITDGTASVYIYANKYNYGALDDIGTEIELTGKVIEYNGLTEISSIVDNLITTISEGNEVVPTDIVLDDIDESIEGDLVRLTDLTIQRVDISDDGGYDIVVSSGDAYGTIRIDKYLEDYPDPETLEAGMIIDVIGSIGQYLDNYQIMICNSEAITYH